MLSNLSEETNFIYEYWNKNILSIPVFTFETDPLKYIKIIKDFHADLIWSFSSILIDIIDVLRNHPELGDMEFRYIATSGEILTEKERKLIQEFFGGEVFDYYGCEEFGLVGAECHQHHGCHLKSESFVLEILDEDGLPVSPGEIGRVVLTYFDNEIMPFIRYDLEDLGLLLPGPCLCGSPRPRFRIYGRRPFILDVNGRRINYFHFYQLFRPFDEFIDRYQLIYYRKQKTLLVKIIPRTNFQNVKGKILGNLIELLGPDVQIAFELVTHILRIGRKYQPILVQ